MLQHNIAMFSCYTVIINVSLEQKAQEEKMDNKHAKRKKNEKKNMKYKDTPKP